MSDIHSLIDEYKESESQADRIVGFIIENLTHRKGIKQAIYQVDYDIQKEMFADLSSLISYQEGLK